MIIALWVILVLLLVWISLSELPAGWGWPRAAALPHRALAVRVDRHHRRRHLVRLPARMAAYGVCNRWLDRFTPTQNRVLHE